MSSIVAAVGSFLGGVMIGTVMDRSLSILFQQGSADLVVSNSGVERVPAETDGTLILAKMIVQIIGIGFATQMVYVSFPDSMPQPAPTSTYIMGLTLSQPYLVTDVHTLGSYLFQ